jgi:tetratricopeptide (TPR) repeat protein
MGSFQAFIDDAELHKHTNIDFAMQQIYKVIEMSNNDRKLLPQAKLYHLLRGYLGILYQKASKGDSRTKRHIKKLSKKSIPLAFYYRGQLKRKAGEYDAAKKYYRKVSDKDPHACRLRDLAIKRIASRR